MVVTTEEWPLRHSTKAKSVVVFSFLTCQIHTSYATESSISTLSANVPHILTLSVPPVTRVRESGKHAVLMNPTCMFSNTFKGFPVSVENNLKLLSENPHSMYRKPSGGISSCWHEVTPSFSLYKSMLSICCLISIHSYICQCYPSIRKEREGYLPRRGTSDCINLSKCSWKI